MINKENVLKIAVITKIYMITFGLSIIEWKKYDLHVIIYDISFY